MRRSNTSILLLVLLVSACAQKNSRYSFARETLVVSLAASQVARFSVEVARGNERIGQTAPGGGISVNTFSSAASTPVKTPLDAYRLAFLDAARKARFIAARAGVTLGQVSSVDEVGSDVSSPNFAGGPVAKSVRIAPSYASGTSPVTLVVSYRSTQPLPVQTITVIGRALDAMLGPGRDLPIDRANVFLNASATDPQAATQALAKYDAYVRETARQIGIPESAIELRDLSVN